MVGVEAFLVNVLGEPKMKHPTTTIAFAKAKFRTWTCVISNNPERLCQNLMG